jgi:cytochrome P450
LWVAARADTVAEIFANPACRVRPMNEPVPGAISGLAAGEVFGHLVRMTDGTPHDRPKLALERALAMLPSAEIAARARHVARQTLPGAGDAAALSTWMFETPVTVVADLLGFAASERPIVVSWTREFVACLSPMSTPKQLATASTAASHLRSRMQSLLQSTETQSDSLLAHVRARAGSVEWTDATAIVSNLVGFLSQTYEATAGLIGNSVVALATHPTLLDEVRAMPDGWERLVHETSRYDSPVQNTRRFVVERTSIAGIALEPGAVVLLVLGAANRDPRANSRPQEFLLDRPDRCVFSFSRGAHACPGQALACGIVSAVLAVLFETMTAGELARLAWSWNPSLNVRLPIFQSINAAARHV